MSSPGWRSSRDRCFGRGMQRHPLDRTRRDLIARRALGVEHEGHEPAVLDTGLEFDAVVRQRERGKADRLGTGQFPARASSPHARLDIA